jgi:Fur family peroxide stress response transcriptional regulator
MVRHAPSPQDSATLERAEAALRSAGLPVTVQRRKLLEGFLWRTDHPAADTLHADVARLVPGLSRATVYRTLETLVELGLAVRIAHPGWEQRYDPRTDLHHHLVCDRCGRVSDHEAQALDALPLPPARSGFVASGYSVQFRGLCAGCARSRRPAAPRAPRRNGA